MFRPRISLNGADGFISHPRVRPISRERLRGEIWFEAKQLRSEVSRPNLMIKVPGYGKRLPSATSLGAGLTSTSPCCSRAMPQQVANATSRAWGWPEGSY